VKRQLTAQNRVSERDTLAMPGILSERRPPFQNGGASCFLS
jgi:hypothetical protein